MNYLFIGDLHIKSENKDDVDLLLLELLSILSECDSSTYNIILGGDIMHYHERLFTQPLNQALHFIQTLNIIFQPVFLHGLILKLTRAFVPKNRFYSKRFLIKK